MQYNEDDMLMLSGIQHFVFCPRQWALIHIEQQWSDNRLTAEGQIMHTRVDDPFYRQKCGPYICLRSVQIASKELGLLVTYDVNTSSEHGARRLRQVAKACQNYGLRVQNSVFECVLDETKFALLRNELLNIIDADNDSVRFYFLGNNWKKRVETIGYSLIFDVENDTLIL